MKFALNDKPKGFSWFSGDGFLNFIFVPLLEWGLTCSRSFPRGVASGGLHLLTTVMAPFQLEFIVREAMRMRTVVGAVWIQQFGEQDLVRYEHYSVYKTSLLEELPIVMCKFWCCKELYSQSLIKYRDESAVVKLISTHKLVLGIIVFFFFLPLKCLIVFIRRVVIHVSFENRKGL